jgi:hypothetical protein
MTHPRQFQAGLPVGGAENPPGGRDFTPGRDSEGTRCVTTCPNRLARLPHHLTSIGQA